MTSSGSRGASGKGIPSDAGRGLRHPRHRRPVEPEHVDQARWLGPRMKSAFNPSSPGGLDAASK
jgi:hypothetical protein